MPKRQKLILAAMVVTISYGVFEFLLAPPSGGVFHDTGSKSKAQDKWITEISEKLNKEKLTEGELYIISKSQTEWMKDPFLENLSSSKSDRTKKEETSGQDEKISLTYSGYLDMGERKLAIINDVEYETGEELQSAGYVVQRIEPTRVILKGKQTPETIIVPIREQFF
jgi:type II secretory pathway component PulC